MARPHNESSHNLSRFQPAGPFSGIKRSLTDGGIRVPFIAWWPGAIEPGESDHVGYFPDWLPTAAELAGAEPPAGTDGISLVPTLLGKTGEQNNVADAHPDIAEKIGAYPMTARTPLPKWEPKWGTPGKKK